MSNSETLLVVAKRPVPGQTKTRLCPPLTPGQAADLYACFLRDTLDIMRKVPHVRRVIGFLPEDARNYFNQVAPDMEMIRQRGTSLGQRLDNLLTDALVDGAARAVVMDSDSPTLPAAYLSQAFERLEGADVVIGPTRDGGYYLIGVKHPQPQLLRRVEMSTSHVLMDTLRLAEASGLVASLLPTWYDVDTITDLDVLESDIAGSSTDGNAAATRSWLTKMDWHNFNKPGNARLTHHSGLE
ncbi:MAG: TIGR04282 family arsenosugar biosynthesis glycosyltransferase [Anaerolineales bacterium]